MKEADDFIDVGEGFTPYAEAGVDLADLTASGWFGGVTDAHRAKARAYWAKIDAKRQERRLALD